MPNLLCADGILAQRFDQVCGCYIVRDIVSVVVQRESSAAASGWKETLVGGCVFEEAGYVVCADEMPATRCWDELVSPFVFFFGAADDAVLYEIAWSTWEIIMWDAWLVGWWWYVLL